MVLTLLLMALLIGCAIKFKFIPFGMIALSADRDTAERDGRTFNYPVAASTKIYAGGLVVLNSAGNAAPGSEATGLVCDGRAEETLAR